MNVFHILLDSFTENLKKLEDYKLACQTTSESPMTELSTSFTKAEEMDATTGSTDTTLKSTDTTADSATKITDTSDKITDAAEKRSESTTERKFTQTTTKIKEKLSTKQQETTSKKLPDNEDYTVTNQMNTKRTTGMTLKSTVISILPGTTLKGNHLKTALYSMTFCKCL